MVRRGFVLVALGVALGALLAGLFAPREATGEEAPAELRAPPAVPSVTAKNLSRPFVEATRRVRPAVVKVINYRINGRGQEQPASSGSAFVISPRGHVLTNRHVVAGARRLSVHLPDGRAFTDVKVLGTDARSDVAILRVAGAEGLTVAPLGDSDRLEVGEWVIAIGAPFELDSSVSAGVVSATGRTSVLGATGADSTEEFIQTDAALNPGNSGGPLVNLDGQVVGINTAIQTGGFSAVNAGVGFAIPINLARTVALSLIEHGIARRGYLGVELEVLPRDDLVRSGLDAPGALRVRSVRDGSPAHKAGLRADAWILAIDGRQLSDLQALRARLAAAGPDSSVELTVREGDRTRTVRVKLGEEPLYTYGLEVHDLDEEAAARVGLPAGTPGVVVTEVAPDSPAMLAGGGQLLYPGDAIVRIDVATARVTVASREEFLHVMQQLQSMSWRKPVRFVIHAKGGYEAVILQRPENS
ncbi:MAG: trypsin-like peptidase domain-containing protein [Planctomycetota bacterium]